VNVSFANMAQNVSQPHPQRVPHSVGLTYKELKKHDLLPIISFLRRFDHLAIGYALDSHPVTQHVSLRFMTSSVFNALLK